MKTISQNQIKVNMKRKHKSKSSKWSFCKAFSESTFRDLGSNIITLHFENAVFTIPENPVILADMKLFLILWLSALAVTVWIVTWGLETIKFAMIGG